MLVQNTVRLLQVTADEGILHARGSGVPPVTKDYCIIYSSDWKSLPKSLDNAVSILQR